MTKLCKIAATLVVLLLTAGTGEGCNQERKVFIGCTLQPFSERVSKCLETVTEIPKGPLTHAQTVQLNAVLRRSELRLQRCGFNSRDLYNIARRHCATQAHARKR